MNLLPFLLFPALTQGPAGFTVHLERDLGPISPGVFGINGPDKYIDWTVKQEVGRRLREGGFRVVRMGLVQDGIYQHRDVYPAPGHWNFKALDAMVKTVTDAGAEPLISVIGFPGGVPHKLDAEGKILSADWDAYARFVAGAVKHFGQKVRYWEMWNEPTNEPDGKFATREAYAEFVRKVSPAMRRENPNVKLIGPVHAWSDLGAGGWVEFGAKELGKELDFLCWHDYGGGPDQSDADRMAWPRTHYDANVRLGTRFVGPDGKRFGTAITEYNMSWQSGSDAYNAQYHTVYNAAFAGAAVLRAIRSRLDIFCFYLLAQDGRNNLGLVDNKSFAPFPTFYAFKILTHELGSRQILVDGDAPGLEIVATREGKRVAVALVNTSSAPRTVRLRFDGKVGRTVRVREVSTEHHGEPILRPADPLSVSLPPLSVSTYSFSADQP